MTKQHRYIAIMALGVMALSGCAGSGENAKNALGKDIAAQRANGKEVMCPAITQFVVSPTTVECGSEIHLQIAGVAPAGSDITYAWEIEGQTFDTGEHAVWKTPTSRTIADPQRAYNVRGIVSDGQCSVTQAVKVQVTCNSSSAIGAADLVVHFAFAKANLDAAARSQLDEFAQKIMTSPNYAVIIEGHTDYVGPESKNKTLGQRRADAVRDYFVTQWKIDSGRFMTRSFGEDAPVASNQTKEGRSQNRRAEIFRVILSTK